jgi:hypothetical protein
VRGATKALLSSTTDSEQTYSTSLTAFNSDGFALGSDDKSNGSSGSYAAWTWDAGSSTVTNNAGSISSQVRANASAGFSVVGWTGTGSNLTVGHGLGVAPALIIVKRRDTGSTWSVGSDFIGWDSFLRLHSTEGRSIFGPAWQSTAPTSSVFYIGAWAGVNASGSPTISYCFAPVEGYSAFGSYTGNNNADGPFIYTGIRPKFVMLKVSSTSGGGWIMYDSSRDLFNLTNKKLGANLSDSENNTLGGDTIGIDFCSNGFKVRTTGTNHNESGATYIYMAFAEHPFAYARAR